ncbi:MAG: hypothetical protein ACM3KL_04425 [Alphaproteobacteria bacterium]
MKNFATLLPVAALLLFAASGPALAGDKKATITIINQSKWEIHHLYLSATSNKRWGLDQLVDQVLATGGSFTLTNVPCDRYDVKVVDEDGDECVIEQVDLCNDKTQWKITDKQLLACVAETE